VWHLQTGVCKRIYQSEYDTLMRLSFDGLRALLLGGFVWILACSDPAIRLECAAIFNRSFFSSPSAFMALDLEQIRRVARLARITVNEAEARASAEQLNGVMDLIAQMQAVDTTGIAPMSHALDVVQRLRADVVSETDQRSAYQAIAPAVEAGLYLVPKVIE